VKARILHVSDLHIRRLEPLAALDALRSLCSHLDPSLVIASGDLAHRGRRTELEGAAEALRALERPFLAVPGNHDIPYTVARFMRPFALWTEVFGDTEPVYRDENLVVLGLNSVQPRRHQEGALSERQLARARAELGAARDLFKVVTFHHHVASSPWRAPNKAPVERREHVLRSLAAAGADLVVGGHVHQAGIASRREFEVFEDGERGLVLATVPGLGRPRPRRSGEAQGVNVYDVDPETLTVTTFSWKGDGFVEVGRRVFPRE
jgi:3',5'-cyclic AMP phosphodiesterase CpdA